jgi:hypothetical protein
MACEFLCAPWPAETMSSLSADSMWLLKIQSPVAALLNLDNFSRVMLAHFFAGRRLPTTK